MPNLPRQPDSADPLVMIIPRSVRKQINPAPVATWYKYSLQMNYQILSHYERICEICSNITIWSSKNLE